MEPQENTIRKKMFTSYEDMVDSSPTSFTLDKLFDKVNISSKQSINPKKKMELTLSTVAGKKDYIPSTTSKQSKSSVTSFKTYLQPYQHTHLSRSIYNQKSNKRSRCQSEDNCVHLSVQQYEKLKKVEVEHRKFQQLLELYQIQFKNIQSVYYGKPSNVLAHKGKINYEKVELYFLDLLSRVKDGNRKLTKPPVIYRKETTKVISLGTKKQEQKKIQ